MKFSIPPGHPTTKHNFFHLCIAHGKCNNVLAAAMLFIRGPWRTIWENWERKQPSMCSLMNVNSTVRELRTVPREIRFIHRMVPCTESVCQTDMCFMMMTLDGFSLVQRVKWKIALQVWLIHLTRSLQRDNSRELRAKLLGGACVRLCSSLRINSNSHPDVFYILKWKVEGE